MNWDMLSIFAALFILTITSFHIYIFSLQGVNGEEYSDRRRWNSKSKVLHEYS